MFLLELTDTPNCPSCGTVEDIENDLWEGHLDVRDDLLRTVREAKGPYSSVKDIVSRGYRESTRVVFSALLAYLTKSGVDRRL